MYECYLEPISDRETVKKKYWVIRDALIYRPKTFFLLSIDYYNIFPRANEEKK